MGMVAQEFVDAAGEMPRTDFCKIEGPDSAISIQAMFFLRPNGVPQAAGIFSRNRPEGRKEAVQAVLPEREVWTVQELCARIEIPYEQPERISIGHIMGELGWVRTRSPRMTAIYTRSQPAKVSDDFNVRVAAVAYERDVWDLAQLCARLNVEASRSAQTMAGKALRALGFVSDIRWNGAERANRRVYTKPSAQS